MTVCTLSTHLANFLQKFQFQGTQSLWNCTIKGKKWEIIFTYLLVGMKVSDGEKRETLGVKIKTNLGTGKSTLFLSRRWFQGMMGLDHKDYCCSNF